MNIKGIEGGIPAGELTVISSGSNVGKSVFMDALGNQKVYPDGSVGQYTCQCSTCDAWFTGHKRDHTCPDCESKIPKQQELPLDGQGTTKKDQ